MTPLKTSWMQLYTPITDNLKLDMRMNLKTRKVSATDWLLLQANGGEAVEGNTAVILVLEQIPPVQ